MHAHEAVRRIVPVVIALAGGLAMCRTSQSQEIPGYPLNVTAYDAREVAMLPRYCIYTQSFRSQVPGGNNQEVIDGWYAQLGPIFHALHHYCWGLMKTNRGVLLARSQTARQFYLTDSITEFDYVITRAPDDFVLLPEILTKKGENLILLGKGPLGITELERAADLKPDYWPPYAHMSDYYKRAGDTKKARELLETGLTHAPDAQGLLRRLAELEPRASRKSGKHPQEASSK